MLVCTEDYYGGERTYKNIRTAPATRIRRVVLDHAASTAVFVYSQASSIVISPAPTDMLTGVDLQSSYS